MSGKDFIHIVTVGDSKTGKSSLLSVFKDGHVSNQDVPGNFETFSKKMKIDGHKVELGLWDTSGDDKYAALRRMSYPQCSVFILCYAVNSRKSFENIKSKWEPEVHKSGPTTPIVLVATKRDLRPRVSVARNGSKELPQSAIITSQNGAKPKPVERFVNMDEGMRLANDIGACAFLESSAHTHEEGVVAVFEMAAKAALNNSDGKRAQGSPKKSKSSGGILSAFKK